MTKRCARPTRRFTAADVFEAGSTSGESFVNSWPLRDFIAKQITPELMADIAAAHRAGRRLFIVTTNLDAERSMVWNMGAIAAHGGDAGDQTVSQCSAGVRLGTGRLSRRC